MATAAVAAMAIVATSCATPATTPDPDVTTTPSESPTTSASPTPSEVALLPSDAVTVFAYEFDWGMLDLGRVRQPTQVHAVVAVPEGPGPFPVAAVIHGSHPTCVAPTDTALSEVVALGEWPEACPNEGRADYLRNDVGLTPYVEALAAAGYLAIAFDVNAAVQWWGGEVDPVHVTDELLATHLAVLDDLHTGVDVGFEPPVDLFGRIDTTQLFVAGHSVGGGYVHALLAGELTRPRELLGAAMLEPQRRFEPATKPVPTLLIRGECDEDVGIEAGLTVLDEVVTAGSPSVLDVLLPGTGHRDLNAGLQGNACPAGVTPAPADLAVAQASLTVAQFALAVRTGQEMLMPAIDGMQPEVRALVGPTPASTVVPTRTWPTSRSLSTLVSTIRRLPAHQPDERFNANWDSDL